MASKAYSKAFGEVEKSPEFIAETMAAEFISGIWHAMEAKGLSQKDLAKQLGKKPALVSRTLAGPQNVTLRTIAEFMVATGLQSHIVCAPLESSWAADRWTNYSTSLGSSVNEQFISYASGRKSFEVRFDHRDAENQKSYAVAAPLRRVA